MPMVDTIPEISPIKGLKFKKIKRSLVFKINSSEKIRYLKIQETYLQETLKKTIEERDEIDDQEINNNMLEERITGLRIARDIITDQIEIEETREAQEEDISRLQKFKEWAKENIVGLSAIAISVAEIITYIIVGVRSAISKGAHATSKFAKAVANLAKKLGPLLAPLLNIIGQAISWGAKGLAWLANNLWVLALAFAWFIYDQYKQRRK